MAPFKVGDYVEYIGSLVFPAEMRFGHIVRVIPHSDLPEHLTEYAVRFPFIVATFYQVQLRLAVPPPSDNTSSQSSR